MKYFALVFLFLASFTFCLAGCNQNDEPTTAQNVSDNPANNKMKITVGSTIFTATLNDNATATAFKAMLPLTITMSELNQNEKFYYFDTTLPTNASTGGNIQTGDLMLYENNCLVLFYKNLNTTYRYTRIGKIDNAAALAAALGKGNSTVKFELQ